MTAPTFPLPIRSAADLPAAITRLQAAGDVGMCHLLRALRAGRCAVLPVLPGTSHAVLKRFAALTASRPAVAIVGDDDGADRGPRGWPLAQRAVAWANAIVLHAAAAETAHYEAAILAAQVVGRVLIVECSTATFPAWRSMVEAAPHKPRTLAIVPREGVHPLPVDRRAMQ